MTVDVQELLKGKVALPSLPVIFSRINEAVNNPRMSIADIGKIISEDTALSARLLKIANSAFYGFPSKIDTISRAVTVIGTQQLRDLALATVVLKIFKGIPRDLVEMESFWKHSIACAITSRVLATYRRESNVERYFVAGILHDVGRLVLCVKYPEEMKAALAHGRQHPVPLYRAEQEVLGISHAEVGGILIKQWNLPAVLEEVLLFHHTPSRAERYPVEVAVIHLADIISHAMQLGNSGESLVPGFDPASWNRIGLHLSLLSPLMNQVDRQFLDTVQTIVPESHL
jgi:HD-like signal output (HDOD) protein